MKPPLEFRSPPSREPDTPPPPVFLRKPQDAPAPEPSGPRWMRAVLGFFGLVSAIGGRATPVLADPGPVAVEMLDTRRDDAQFAIDVTLDRARIQCTGLTEAERDACVAIVRAAVGAGDVPAVEPEETAEEDGTLSLWLDFAKVAAPALITVAGTIGVELIRGRKSADGEESGGKDDEDDGPPPPPPTVVVVNRLGFRQSETVAADDEALAALPETVRDDLLKML